MAAITQITTYRTASRWHPGDVAALRRLHPQQPWWGRHLWWCLWYWPQTCFLAEHHVAEADPTIIGYVQLAQSGSVSVTVDPQWRRRGVATTLLRVLQTYALPTDTAMTVSIAAGNGAAQGLLRRTGFVRRCSPNGNGQEVWVWYAARRR